LNILMVFFMASTPIIGVYTFGCDGCFGVGVFF